MPKFIVLVDFQAGLNCEIKAETASEAEELAKAEINNLPIEIWQERISSAAEFTDVWIVEMQP